MTETAYSGEVTLHEAKWTDKEGSTVTFKLPMNQDAEEKRNPFHEHTKRRKGRAGTRFMMVCRSGKMMVYADEVMLAGWNDSQTSGHTVKLWLAMDTMGHPFEGFERNKDKFEIALVELDDDNEMIDPKVRDRVERVKKRPSERLSYVAAMLCKNEGFHTYVLEQTEYTPQDIEVMGIDDIEEYCRQWMCYELGIKSRSELDKSNVLAERFHSEIRKPFVEWQGEV